MKHYNEEILELLALNPYGFDKREKDEITSHIATCAVCRIKYEYFTQFYTDYRNTENSDQSKIDEFVSGLYPVIPLYPYIHLSKPEQNEYLTVLAAMTTVQSNERFNTVSTLTSEEHHAVVRILQDKTTNRFRFYIMTDDPGKRAYSVLSYPDISIDFVTDSKGQLEIEYSDIDWGSEKAVLRITVAELPVNIPAMNNNAAINRFSTRGGLYSVVCSYRDGELSFSVDRNKSFVPWVNFVSVSVSGSETFFIPLDKGKGSCKFASIPETAVIRLYC